MKEKPTVVSPFWGLPSDRVPKAKKDETNLSGRTFPHVAILVTDTN